MKTQEERLEAERQRNIRAAIRTVKTLPKTLHSYAHDLEYVVGTIDKETDNDDAQIILNVHAWVVENAHILTEYINKFAKPAKKAKAKGQAVAAE